MKINQQKIKAKVYQEIFNRAIKKKRSCFHPDCKEQSINSHILQRNGILSTIAEESHVMELKLDVFRNPKIYFKETGLKEAFSFNCFCNHHDTELFKSIETNDIDFNIYRNRLLFTLRTIYNEKFRKLILIDTYKNLLSNHRDKYNPDTIQEIIHEENIGLEDIEKIANVIWADLNNNSESFIFKIREIEQKEICLSAFYNYETTQELQTYFWINKKQKEDVIDIFVNLFPYKNKSIFMMGYKKNHHTVVSKYVDSFFTDNEDNLESKITNLMMFQCETWAISKSFYKNRISGKDDIFEYAVQFSGNNNNERLFYDINIFKDDFISKFNTFKMEKVLLGK
tara:strand:+ start:5106 stop:6125 length:1020 start_codon:yes stop_codon:yes gene_type:complete